MRIHDVKRGPFFEHSSQLFSIATGVPNWTKVNSGLFKMYRVRDFYMHHCSFEIWIRPKFWANVLSSNISLWVDY